MDGTATVRVQVAGVGFAARDVNTPHTHALALAHNVEHFLGLRGADFRFLALQLLIFVWATTGAARVSGGRQLQHTTTRKNALCGGCGAPSMPAPCVRSNSNTSMASTSSFCLTWSRQWTAKSAHPRSSAASNHRCHAVLSNSTGSNVRTASSVIAIKTVPPLMSCMCEVGWSGVRSVNKACPHTVTTTQRTHHNTRAAN